MLENMQELENKFKEIKAMGWILAPHNRNSEHGNLFEKLLNKPMENFEIPDYEGIEIKTHLKMSHSYTTLFNANPEGKEFFEINRLCSLYGYPDSQLKDVKILQGDVTARALNNIGLWYKFMLDIDQQQESIYLNIYNHKGILIDHTTYWSFSILKEKLHRKLSTLAYITVESKKVNGKYYFRYVDIKFYKLKQFSQFLKLIDDGKIKVTFTVGVFRTGERKGQLHNHGTGFRINEEHLPLLFEPICCI